MERGQFFHFVNFFQPIQVSTTIKDEESINYTFSKFTKRLKLNSGNASAVGSNSLISILIVDCLLEAFLPGEALMLEDPFTSFSVGAEKMRSMAESVLFCGKQKELMHSRHFSITSKHN